LTKIRQLEFVLGKEYPDEIAFSRSLGTTTTTDIAFAAPFHGLWIASLCRSGRFTIVSVHHKLTGIHIFFPTKVPLSFKSGFYTVYISASGNDLFD
jgi:hypothetical protein